MFSERVTGIKCTEEEQNVALFPMQSHEELLALNTTASFCIAIWQTELVHAGRNMTRLCDGQPLVSWNMEFRRRKIRSSL
jgi:hypothetical protein